MAKPTQVRRRVPTKQLDLFARQGLFFEPWLKEKTTFSLRKQGGAKIIRSSFVQQHAFELRGLARYLFRNWRRPVVSVYEHGVGHLPAGVELEKLNVTDGVRSDHHLKLIMRGRSYFLKMADYQPGELQASQLATRYLEDRLRSVRYRYGGYRVKIIHPLAAYESKREQVITISPFMDLKRVQKVSEMNDSRLEKLLHQLNQEVESKLKVDGVVNVAMDLEPRNCFFESKTKTLWLYDVGWMPRDKYVGTPKQVVDLIKKLRFAGF